MANSEQKKLFQGGSKTYFTSSLFFPPRIRDYVTRLYAFVRKADNFVDAIPQQEREFHRFRKQYETAFSRYSEKKEKWQSGDYIIDDYIELAAEKNFDPAWMTAFLEAMQADLSKKTYDSLKETEQYMYGSAEVIGLFMCRILEIPEKAYPFAQLLGKAMQYINFVRDINEDIALGRQYLPTTELRKFGFSSLSEQVARANPDAFSAFVRAQIAHFSDWQHQAEAGYSYIPRRYRIAIKTAADMYIWTAAQICKNPHVIFEKKVKPSKIYLTMRAFINFAKSLGVPAKA